MVDVLSCSTGVGALTGSVSEHLVWIPVSPRRFYPKVVLSARKRITPLYFQQLFFTGFQPTECISVPRRNRSGRSSEAAKRYRCYQCNESTADAFETREYFVSDIQSCGAIGTTPWPARLAPTSGWGEEVQYAYRRRRSQDAHEPSNSSELDCLQPRCLDYRSLLPCVYHDEGCMAARGWHRAVARGVVW